MRSASEPVGLAHLGDDDAPCAHHGPASPAAVATLAAIGSRTSAFNHDIASKLQGLMMALDEIGELLEEQAGAPTLKGTVESAHQTLRELGALLSANRTLTRATARTTVELGDWVRGAGERIGVAVHGTLPAGTLANIPPLLGIALGLALDASAGTGRNRTIDVTATATTAADAGTVTLTFPSREPAPANAADSLAIAAHVIAGAGGALRCGADRALRITLPFAAPAVAP